MPTINRLPIGGGGASSSGAAGLNIFTQLNEPEKKDGIWIQTNSQYEKIITDARILNQNNDVWEKRTGYECAYVPGDYPAAQVYEYDGYVYGMHPVNNGNNSIFKMNPDNGSYTDIPLINTGAFGKPILVDSQYFYYVSASDVYRCNLDNNTSTLIYNNINHNQISSNFIMYNNHLCVAYCNTDGYNYPFFIYDFELNKSIITGPNVNRNLGPVVVHNGCIYYIAINVNTADNTTYKMYRYNGTAWTAIDTTIHLAEYFQPFLFLFGNELHIICAQGHYYYHYRYDGNSFIQLSSPPNNNESSLESYYCAVHNNIYIFGNTSGSICKYSLSYNEYNDNTLILQRGETGNGKHQTAFADLTKSVSGVNRFISGFDDCFYYGNGSFENAPMYYGNGSQWIRFKN